MNCYLIKNLNGEFANHTAKKQYTKKKKIGSCPRLGCRICPARFSDSYMVTKERSESTIKTARYSSLYHYVFSREGGSHCDLTHYSKSAASSDIISIVKQGFYFEGICCRRCDSFELSTGLSSSILKKKKPREGRT